ncbi:MAG: hypothetical protein SA398_01155 [Methanosarcina sp.]|nr:hypothetical protein [Methanosarcina sp.]MDW5548841.1 hypothetical protein [Methanosarcina sp.]MDW5553754.1 hypothetical protein [Methanosarcina sp.]MDW5558980.1 hypothetical protein [Methanosarcina sp.]
MYTIFLFILAGIFEIGGGYLMWLWLREDRGLIFAFSGQLSCFDMESCPLFSALTSIEYMQLMAVFLLLFPSYGAGFLTKSLPIPMIL